MDTRQRETAEAKDVRLTLLINDFERLSPEERPTDIEKTSRYLASDEGQREFAEYFRNAPNGDSAEDAEHHERMVGSLKQGHIVESRGIGTEAEAGRNVALAYLQRTDSKLDRALDDLHDVKVRLTGVEENLAGVHRRIDRLEERVARIERRLELVEVG